MERVARIFGSFEDAELADDQLYADLTPEERLDILLELVERHRSSLDDAASRFVRIHRITELSNVEGRRWQTQVAATPAR